MRFYFFILLCLSALNHLMAQTTISGHVFDRSGAPIQGASVFILSTYEGATSNEAGRFSFTTSASGEIEIQVSFLGYSTETISAAATTMQDLKVTLRETVSALNAVVVSASTFTAGDNSKVAVLKPLDIVTTAGSAGDVIAALQTLPGTQANPEDGRLFVRGGAARETNIYVDGLRVFTPYIRTVGGSPTRGRFSPFLFKGVSFASGGYSAAYGQALSGVLDLQTTETAEQTESNINLMSLGVNIGHTQRWKKQSLSINSSYINLSPYTALMPSRIDWLKPYRGFSGEAVYRHPTDNGIFKVYLATDNNSMRIGQDNLDTGRTDTISIRNQNLYANASYRGFLSDKTSLFAGVSAGLNQDHLNVQPASGLRQDLQGVHARLSLKTVWSDRIFVDYGLEYQREHDRQTHGTGAMSLRRVLDRGQTAGFGELNYYFSTNLAIRVGLRAEHYGLTNQLSLNPRFTLAQKVAKHGQVSAAYGSFVQAAGADLLFTAPGLEQERAQHFLLNYNLKTKTHILRLEGYYKRYSDLVRFNGPISEATDFSNTGNGFAYGFDCFWRANGLIKNVDFWVSYSWLEHERRYRNFPVQATPGFSTRHNLSLVSKIWIPKLKSQLGLTFNLISGRPYENPNTAGFLNERSPAFRGLNLSWAYLIDQQKILFFSASNVTGFRNEFGYEYASMPDATGYFPGRVLRPNDDRFFFVGFFVTLSPDKTKNQLDNL